MASGKRWGVFPAHGLGDQTPPAPIYTQNKNDQRGGHMKEVLNEDRLTQLESLLEVIANAIDEGPGARDLGQLSKQYRETLAEIEEIRGMNFKNDEIGEILSKRRLDGKSGTLR